MLRFWKKKKGYYEVKRLKYPKGKKGYVGVDSNLGFTFIKAKDETVAIKKLTKEKWKEIV